VNQTRERIKHISKSNNSTPEAANNTSHKIITSVKCQAVPDARMAENFGYSGGEFMSGLKSFWMKSL